MSRRAITVDGDTFPFWFNIVHSQVERPIGQVDADLRDGGSLGLGTLFDWRYYR